MAAAFNSPDTLQSATAFLRQYAADTDAHAACAVVPRSCIAYPQVRRLRTAWAPPVARSCTLEANAWRRAAKAHQCMPANAEVLATSTLRGRSTVWAMWPQAIPCLKECGLWLLCVQSGLHGVLCPRR